MALADPQTVTISGTGFTCARITPSTLNEGAFQDPTASVKLTVKHDTSRRTRHIIKAQKSLIVADPLFPSQNQNVSFSASIILDHPKNGVVMADVVALANALVAWATSPQLTKVAAGES